MLGVVNLPSYSLDCNADETVWGWVREEGVANLCLGIRAAVGEKVGDFFARLSGRREAVKRRSRTVLQVNAVELMGSAQADWLRPGNVDLALASVQLHINLTIIG